jgi:uncharacterized protein
MKRTAIDAAGFVLGLALALTIPSLADTTSPAPGTPARTVTVTGTGTIHATPDEAIISLGVQTQADSAQDAMQRNAEQMVAVFKALADLGIKGGDLSTTGVNLNPNYGPNGGQVSGYTASNQVQVTVRDVGNVGKVIDAAVAAGANLTNGITFQLSDQNKGETDALQAAVDNAKTKAQALADAAGAQLGPVVTISEATAPTYPPVYVMAADAAGAATTPVNPPTLETQVSVTVVWSLV